ncbi:MAG: biotin transporter BioY [Litorilinea sp.]
MFRTRIDHALNLPQSARTRLARHAVAILFFAMLTAVTARLAIPLPFTPVPITLQVWAILLSGLVLGRRAGAGSQIAYLVALLAGLPISTTGLGGPGVFLGPTGGYLLAFPVGAFVAGWIIEQLPLRHGWAGFAIHLLAGLAGVLAIYAGGVAWLTVLLGDIATAIAQGALPFLGADLFKVLLAALAASGGRAFLNPTPKP